MWRVPDSNWRKKYIISVLYSHNKIIQHLITEYYMLQIDKYSQFYDKNYDFINKCFQSYLLKLKTTTS